MRDRQSRPSKWTDRIQNNGWSLASYHLGDCPKRPRNLGCGPATQPLPKPFQPFFIAPDEDGCKPMDHQTRCDRATGATCGAQNPDCPVSHRYNL
jgi:hypothetical protein